MGRSPRHASTSSMLRIAANSVSNDLLREDLIELAAAFDECEAAPQSRRRQLVKKYGERLVHLAEMNGLSCEEAAAAITEQGEEG